MDHEHIAELARVMERETALFELILAQESRMSLLIKERDWEGLERTIRTVDAVESDLRALEKLREGLFGSILAEAGLPADASFYQMAVNLPVEERNEITDIYRSLKYRALAARAAGQAISSYLAESRAVLSGIMEEVFPQKKARTYDRRGGRREAELTAAVLSQSI